MLVDWGLGAIPTSRIGLDDGNALHNPRVGCGSGGPKGHLHAFMHAHANPTGRAALASGRWVGVFYNGESDGWFGGQWAMGNGQWAVVLRP